MKKDILIPEVKNVYVAAVLMTNDTGDQQWWIHLINDSTSPLENVMIQSRGYSDLDTNSGQKTATLRKVIQVLPAKSAAKLEPIMPEVFHLFQRILGNLFRRGHFERSQIHFRPAHYRSCDQRRLAGTKG